MLFSYYLAQATTFLTLANAAVVGKRAFSGDATTYGGNLAGGTCSFTTYSLPAGIFGTALTGSSWSNSANCGRCVSITGPKGNKITAMVVDQCPSCGTNQLDLFPDAFSKLAANPGIIHITWDYVDCPISTPLQLHNKDGVSAYYFSMQVVNANKGVKSLEVSTDHGSTWKPTTRQTYNFFLNTAGFGTTTVDVRVTSVDGQVVVVKNVAVSSGASTTAGSNFGTSPHVAALVASVPTEAAPVVAAPVVAAPVVAAPVVAAPVKSTPESKPEASPVATIPTTTVAPVATTAKKPTKLVFTPKPAAVAVDEEDDTCIAA